MKKTFLFSVLLAGLLSVAFISCKKDNDPQKSRRDLITGTWRIEAAGEDQNGNGTLEPAEYDSLLSVAVNFGATINQIFNADGSGKLDAQFGGRSIFSMPFSWSLTNNDEQLTITEMGEEANLSISTLTETRFEGFEAGTMPRTILVLTR